MPALPGYRKLGHDPIDQATMVNTRGLYREITDSATAGIVYIGRAPVGSLTSESVWRIERRTTTGLVVDSDFALSGANTAVWDNRATYFTPFTGTSNLYSLQFDGVNDYVNHGDNFNFERTDSWSFFAWINQSGGVAMAVFSKRQSSAPIRGWDIQLGATGTILVTLCSTSTTNQLVKTTTAVTTPNVWTHVGFTYNGNSDATGLLVYINGVAQATTTNNNTLSATIVQTVTSLATQGSRNAINSFYNGLIDEVMLWNRVLTPAEVSNLFTTGWRDPNAATYASALTNWYRNGDGDTFPIITDRKGIIPGTMTGMGSNQIVLNAPV